VETLKAIEARRSIRRFKLDSIPQEDIEKILQAGILTPLGKNKQPWKFYIVQNDRRQAMTNEMLKGIIRLEAMGGSTGSARHDFGIQSHQQASFA